MVMSSRVPSSAGTPSDKPFHSTDFGYEYRPFTSVPPVPAVGSPLGEPQTQVGSGFALSTDISLAQQQANESDGVLARPIAVRIATFALLTAGVLSLVLAGMGVAFVWELRDTTDRLLHLDPSGTVSLLAAGYADGAETVLTMVIVGVGALVAIGYMLVARSVWKGSNWPRNLSPFLLVLSLPAVLLGIVGPAIVAAGFASTVATWTPSARAFCSRRRGR